LTTARGHITKINGGPKTRTLCNHLESYGDENACVGPGEALIGINSKATAHGVPPE
jgi:hypothetical protein